MRPGPFEGLQHFCRMTILLWFGPTMLDTRWNRCAAISGRARVKV